jgi:hypothetical protein
MHHAVRRLVTVAVAVASAVACGETQRLPAMGEVISDTLMVYALTGTPVSYPTALNLRDLVIVRATGAFDYEIAFDIDENGNAVLSPMELLVAAEAPFRRVGMQKFTTPFDSLTSAPRTGYVYDQKMILGAGESIVIEAAVPCQYPYPQVIFGKLKVDSISSARRAIYMQVVSDPSCGFRSLVPGTIPRR